MKKIKINDQVVVNPTTVKPITGKVVEIKTSFGHTEYVVKPEKMENVTVRKERIKLVK